MGVISLRRAIRNLLRNGILASSIGVFIVSLLSFVLAMKSRQDQAIFSIMDSIKSNLLQSIIEGDYYQVIDQTKKIYETDQFSHLSVTTNFGYQIKSFGQQAKNEVVINLVDDTNQIWGVVRYSVSYEEIIRYSIVFAFICLMLVITLVFVAIKLWERKYEDYFYPLKIVIDKLSLSNIENTSIESLHYDEKYSDIEEIASLQKAMNRYIILSEERKRIELKNQRNAAIARTTQALAHDVRRPFTMLKGILSIIEASPSGQAKKISSEFSHEITNAIENVNGMIEDILQVGAHAPPKAESVEIEKIILLTLNGLFKIDNESDIRFIYNFEHSRRILVDRIQIQRVFTNIINNAVEAVNKSGKIWIYTRESTKHMQVTIGNSESYIPSNDLNHIFDAFFTKGKLKGTGIGLSLTKDIIDSHGGKIWCTSSKESGTEFHFTLPLSDSQYEVSIDLPTCSQTLVASL